MVLWFLSDVLMFLTTIITFVVLKKLTAPATTDDVEESVTESTTAPLEPSEEEGGYTSEQYVILKRTGKICIVFF